MNPLEQLREKDERLYARLQEHVNDLQEDARKKAVFQGEIMDFLASVKATGPEVRTIEEYHWLVEMAEKWQSSMMTVMGIPTETVQIPMPEHLQRHTQPRKVVPLAPELRRLPLALVVHVSRATAERLGGVSPQAQWMSFVQELAGLGYRVNEEHEKYLRAFFNITVQMVEFEKRVGYVKEALAICERFVSKQRGVWEHSQWVELILSLQQRGLRTSGNALSYYGDILEAMKGLYLTMHGTLRLNQSLNEIIERAVTFLQEHNMEWDHSAWEGFLRDLREGAGTELSDEVQTYIGSLLEAAKHLYLAQMGIKN